MRGRADPESAGGVGSDFAASIVADGGSVAGRELADGADAIGVARRVECGGAGLGHAVDFVDGEAGERGEFAFQFVGNFVASADADAERPEVVGRGPMIADEAEEGSGQHAEKRRPSRAHEREELIAIDGTGDVDATTAAEAGECHRDGCDVRRGRTGQKDVVGRDGEGGGGAGDRARRTIRACG